MTNKNRWLLKILFVISLLVVSTATSNKAHAQEILSATLSVKSQDFTVGDVIPLELSITHPAGWRVVVPTLEQQWGEFEVRNQSVPEIIDNTDGTQTTIQQINVARMRPGDVETPALSLSIADDQGRLIPLQVAPVPLSVRSVLVEGDTNLREIKPQAELISERRPYWPLIVAGLLGAAALAIHGFNHWRRRKLIDKRTPRQRALDSLAVLSRQNMQTSAEIKLQCTLLANTLRDYLARISQLPARDLTTRELARHIKDQEIAPVWSALIVEVLQVCDGVKFANEEVELLQLQGMISAVKQFVEQYPPQPEPAKKRRLGIKNQVEGLA